MSDTNSALWKLLILIFPVVFNITFFSVTGSEHPVSVWISYAFINIAYFMLPSIPLLIKKYKSRTDIVRPLYLIASIYFFIELVVGILFIYLNQGTINPAFIIQMIMFGIFAAIFISNLMVNNKTHESLSKHEDEVSYIKGMASRVHALLDNMPDKASNRSIERTYDLLHASPCQSNQTMQSVEQQVLTLVQQLESAVHDQNREQVLELTKQIQTMMEKRNSNINN